MDQHSYQYEDRHIKLCIEEDKVGWYLICFEKSNMVTCGSDHLLDTLEDAFHEAEIRYGIPREGWLKQSTCREKDTLKLTLRDVQAIYVNLLNAKMSREEADRWAYSMIKQDESDKVIFFPSEDREKIMNALRFLYGIDLRTSTTEYLHSDSDIIHEYKKICSHV